MAPKNIFSKSVPTVIMYKQFRFLKVNKNNAYIIVDVFNETENAFIQYLMGTYCSLSIFIFITHKYIRTLYSKKNILCNTLQ